MTNLSDEYEDQEEQLGKRFEDLCVDLCIEGAVKEEAWDKYKEVSNNYCIDGDQLQWLVCALYECVRKSTTENINSLDNTYVSLTRLLKVSKMSFVQFFHRIRKWADMIDVNVDLRDRIERIESQFSVSSVIFDKYIDSFYQIFQKYDSSTDEVNEEKFKIHFTDEELFKFTWILYIKIKTNFPAVCGDIILSFQLLLCTLDWVASNAIISRAKYIFNPRFKGLSADFFNRNFKPSEKFPTVLKFICENNDMNYIDCKSTRDSYFRNYIEKLLEKEVLKGCEAKDDNVLNSVNFEFNGRALLNLYAEYMMASGDFDERIYLNPNAGEEIGSVGSKYNHGESGYLNSDMTPNAMRYMQEVINCNTIPGSVDTRRPLSTNRNQNCPGKSLNGNSTGIVSRLNGGVNFNNYDSRVMNSNYLVTLLGKRSIGPSDELSDILQTNCFPSPINDIMDRLDRLSIIFLSSYKSKYIDPLQHDFRTILQKKQFDPSLQRLQTIYKLYFMALENIVKVEIAKIEVRYKHRKSTGSQLDSDSSGIKLVDIAGLLKKKEFHEALYAICVEIVMVASDSSKHFPWILDVLNLQALHFYKIVEIFLRCVDLSREMVKYFNQVIEHIVDSYAWKRQSVLWDNLARSGKAPCIDEVTPSDRIEQLFKSGVNASGKKLIVESNRDRSIAKSSMLTTRRLGSNCGQSNLSSGASFRNDDDESARAAAHLLSTDSNDDKSNSTNAITTPCESGDSTRPFVIRHDSMALFFRQMYFLSSLRLRDLCDRLHINRELMCKIWTAFEHVVTSETHLIKDRCIDQIIICCIYSVTKVASNRLMSFHEIIQMYRMQPQSTRQIYREVLIEIVKSDNSSEASSEVHDDIVRFYNSCFLTSTHNYIKRFMLNYALNNPGKSSTQVQPHLSPMPTRSVLTDNSNGQMTNNQNNSESSIITNLTNNSSNNLNNGLGNNFARKITNNKNVFVSPAKTPHVTLSPKRLTFTVNSSPSKDLRDINAMIANAAATKMKGGLSFTTSSGQGLSGNNSGSMLKRSEPSGYYNSSGSTPTISVLDRTGSGITTTKRIKLE